MVALTSCVSTNRTATCQRVCPLRIINVHMTTLCSLSGAIIALTWWARAVRTSPAAVASLHPYQAVRPIASLTSNGERCISPITIRRRISRSGCTRMIPTSGSTISSVLFSLAAINCMSQAYKDRARSLLRTSAMRIRQGPGRGLIPAQGGHRLRRQRLHLLRRQRRHLQRGLLQHPGRARRRIQDRSLERPSSVGEAICFPCKLSQIGVTGAGKN
jgi:hypothetical protein